MRVRDLIRLLAEFDKDATVVFADNKLVVKVIQIGEKVILTDEIAKHEIDFLESAFESINA